MSERIRFFGSLQQCPELQSHQTSWQARCQLGRRVALEVYRGEERMADFSVLLISPTRL